MSVLEKPRHWVTAGHTGRGWWPSQQPGILQGQLLAELAQGLSLTTSTLVFSPRAARST